MSVLWLWENWKLWHWQQLKKNWNDMAAILFSYFQNEVGHFSTWKSLVFVSNCFFKIQSFHTFLTGTNVLWNLLFPSIRLCFYYQTQIHIHLWTRYTQIKNSSMRHSVAMWYFLSYWRCVSCCHIHLFSKTIWFLTSKCRLGLLVHLLWSYVLWMQIRLGLQVHLLCSVVGLIMQSRQGL